MECWLGWLAATGHCSHFMMKTPDEDSRAGRSSPHSLSRCSWLAKKDSMGRFCPPLLMQLIDHTEVGHAERSSRGGQKPSMEPFLADQLHQERPGGLLLHKRKLHQQLLPAPGASISVTDWPWLILVQPISQVDTPFLMEVNEFIIEL